jgi:hypothetical protein
MTREIVFEDLKVNKVMKLFEFAVAISTLSFMECVEVQMGFAPKCSQYPERIANENKLEELARHSPLSSKSRCSIFHAI